MCNGVEESHRYCSRRAQLFGGLLGLWPAWPRAYRHKVPSHRLAIVSRFIPCSSVLRKRESSCTGASAYLAQLVTGYDAISKSMSLPRVTPGHRVLSKMPGYRACMVGDLLLPAILNAQDLSHFRRGKKKQRYCKRVQNDRGNACPYRACWLVIEAIGRPIIPPCPASARVRATRPSLPYLEGKS